MASAIDVSSQEMFIERFVPRVKSGRAVELGCGEGEQCLTLAALGYSVDAVDRDPASFTNLQPFVQSKQLPITPHCRRIEDFLGQTPSNSYDIVLALNVLHYQDFHGRILFFSQFDSIFRVLRPGGHFICSLVKYVREREIQVPKQEIGALAHVTRENLQEIWQGRLQKIYCNPERRYLGQRLSHRQWLCHWDLVASKPQKLPHQ